MTTEKIDPRFIILVAFCELEKANIHELLEFTKLPVATFRRYLASLRKDLAMEIVYVRGPQPRVPGHYYIKDWGLIDKEKFHQKYLMESE